MKIILSILLFAAALQLNADTHYRQGASGANNGTDWANAYTSLSTAYANHARSASSVLWIADTSTSIGSVNFNKAASGTTPMIIRKATVANHGTSTGWDNSYGDGQAQFGNIDINTPYHVLDGQTRTETTRMEQPQGYGFRVNGAIYASGFSGQHNATGSQFSYIDVGGTWSESGSPDCSAPGYSLYFTYQNNVTFTRCVFHNSGVNNGAIAMMHGSSGATFDHCDFYMGWGKATIAAPNNGINNLTVKYCRFWDSSRKDTCPAAEGTGITCEIGSYSTGSGSTHNNNLVYGSIFYGTASGGRNASIQWGDGSPTGGTAMNCKVFNNTFVGFPEASVLSDILLQAGSGNEARNNLFYNTGSASVTANATSGNVDAGSNPFVNYNARDFRLATAVAGGTSLSGAYNTDPDGNTRGGDGTWDVGAYEFGGVQSAPEISNTGTYLWTNGIAGTVLILADGGASSYGATNLPAGLSVSQASGNITGTPTATVTNTVGLFATNSVGFDIATVTFAVLPQAPVLALFGDGDLGLIPTNTTRDASIVVSNAGPSGTTLSGSVSNIIGTPFSLQTSPATYSLASGATKTFTLRYAPTAVGTNRGSVAVNGNHASNYVALSGMAFPVFTGTNWVLTNALVLSPMVKHADNYLTTTQSLAGTTPSGLSGLAIWGYNPTVQTTGTFWGSLDATNLTGGGSITVDAVSSEHVESAVSGETTPHTQGTLTDGYIVASVGIWSASDSTATAATYDGAGMTLLAEHNLDYYGEYRVQIYGLAVGSKTSGTYNFAITANGTLGHYNSGIVSLNNVRQTGSSGTAVDGVGTNATASLTVSSAAGEMVFLAVVRGNVAGAPDSGETERVDTQPEANGESSFPDTLWVGTEPGASSVTTAVDFTGSTTFCATAIPIKPSTNAGLNSLLFSVNALPFSTNLWPVLPKVTNFVGRSYTHWLGTGNVTAPQYFTNAFVLGTSNVFFLQTQETDTKIRELNFQASGEAAADTDDPTVEITGPTGSATHSQDSASITITGTADDDIGVASVTATMTGATTGSIGLEGTTSWGGSTTLHFGVTVITVTAVDPSGNDASDTLTVTRTPVASGGVAYATNLTIGTLRAGQ